MKRAVWSEQTVTWLDGRVQSKWEALGWDPRECWKSAYRYVRSGGKTGVCCPTWFVDKAKEARK